MQTPLKLTATGFFEILSDVHPVGVAFFHLFWNPELPSCILLFDSSFHDYDAWKKKKKRRMEGWRDGWRDDWTEGWRDVQSETATYKAGQAATKTDAQVGNQVSQSAWSGSWAVWPLPCRWEGVVVPASPGEAMVSWESALCAQLGGSGMIVSPGGSLDLALLHFTFRAPRLVGPTFLPRGPPRPCAARGAPTQGRRLSPSRDWEPGPASSPRQRRPGPGLGAHLSLAGSRSRRTRGGVGDFCCRTCGARSP